MFIPSSHLHASSTWISIPIKRSARTRLWHHLLRLILACRCCIQRTPGCREVASKFQGLALFQESNLKNMVQSRSSGQSVCDFGFRKHSISLHFTIFTLSGRIPNDLTCSLVAALKCFKSNGGILQEVPLEGPIARSQLKGLKGLQHILIRLKHIFRILVRCLSYEQSGH